MELVFGAAQKVVDDVSVEAISHVVFGVDELVLVVLDAAIFDDLLEAKCIMLVLVLLLAL